MWPEGVAQGQPGCSASEQVGRSLHSKDDRMGLDERPCPRPHRVTAGSSPGGLSGGAVLDLCTSCLQLPGQPRWETWPGSLGALGAPVAGG